MFRGACAWADGTTHYRYFEQNTLGLKTKEIERWVAGGATRYRTNTFVYASGTGNPAVDNLLLVRRTENGATVLGRALHSTYPDQIRYETNAVGEVALSKKPVRSPRNPPLLSISRLEIQRHPIPASKASPSG